MPEFHKLSREELKGMRRLSSTPTIRNRTQGKAARTFEETYPHIAWWVKNQGWIEMGWDDYSRSFLRALDPGGMIWEGDATYETVDEALQALEEELAEWAQRNWDPPPIQRTHIRQQYQQFLEGIAPGEGAEIILGADDNLTTVRNRLKSAALELGKNITFARTRGKVLRFHIKE